MDSDATGFDTAVDGWVLAAASASHAASFDDLLRVLPGVYPTDVRASVARLSVSGSLPTSTAERLLRRKPAGPPPTQSPSNLPVPHPLDFDWRFSHTAIDRLVCECAEAARGHDIVLIGAPSILQAMQERSLTQSCLLLDANPAAVAALAGTSVHRAELCDIQHDPLPPATAGAVLLDPPWYPEHVHLFLWAAAQVSVRGATVMISLPAVGTRPGVPTERATAIRWADDVGLMLVSEDPGVLGYLSPPFERNALETVGLTDLPEDWRRGDLLTFRATHEKETRRPMAPTLVRWPEVSVGRVRIRVRSDKADDGEVDPRLISVVHGDVLGSVSRRDPRRDLVDVWTSGNRVFATRSPWAVMMLAAAIGDDGDGTERLEVRLGRSLSPVEMRNTLAAMDQLTELTATEAAELLSMGWSA